MYRLFWHFNEVSVFTCMKYAALAAME